MQPRPVHLVLSGGLGRAAAGGGAAITEDLAWFTGALASLRHPFEVAGVRLEIEASAGVASLPDHGEDLEVLLRRADVAMYEAKERGEALVRFELETEQRVPLGSTMREVTSMVLEQALVSDPVGVHATLEGLHRLGIELALDDFGTGHASLTRLKRLPVDEVKIDRAFVTELGAGEEADVAIVRAIVDLARACGLRTIAEGVESDAQRDRLVAIGCEAIQGWLIAPAMPARELEPWLEGSVVPLGRMAG